MRRKYSIQTADKPCKILLTLQGSGLIRFSGICPKTKTLFFSRKKRVNGVENLVFPLPISPKTLEMTIVGKCKVSELTLKPLEEPKISLSPQEHAFIKHIFEFCKRFKTLDTGVFTDDMGRFPIVLSNEIRNRDTKAVMNTPARVSRKTGQIEVSRAKFEKYSLPMQIFILLHERSHYVLQTSSELECDLQALQWYLGFGFSQTEAIYANTKIFSGANPEHNDRAEQLLDYILNYNYQKGCYDHKC
jgi:hypothetical protein